MYNTTPPLPWTAPIETDPNDPLLCPGYDSIPFTRSYNINPNLVRDNASIPAQTNVVTHFLDGSAIYGSDLYRAKALRTFSGGLLKTSSPPNGATNDGDLLPLNTLGLANQPDDSSAFFVGGDVRVSDNVPLLALSTLFVRGPSFSQFSILQSHPSCCHISLFRPFSYLPLDDLLEHNRIARCLNVAVPAPASCDAGLLNIRNAMQLTDDQALYDEARHLVVGTLQKITYIEFYSKGPSVSGFLPSCIVLI